MLAASGAALGMVEAFKLVKDGLESVVEQSAAWQTQLSQAQANTQMTTQQVQTMGNAVIQMSQQSGASLEDLGAGYVHIANLMGSAADATKVLDIAQQSAVSTGGNVADYAQTLARVLHEYGASTDEAAKYMDILHTAAAGGDLTLEQFTENSGTALAAAANYGVGLDQVAAAYTALTMHGMDAAQANTQITDGLMRLTTVTPQVADELKRVSDLTGVNLTSDFTAAGLAAKGYTGILSDLRTAEDDMGMSTGEAYQENMKLGDAFRGGQGLAILAGNGYQDFMDKLAANDNTVASAAKREDDYNRSLNTTGTQFNILKADASALAVTVGGPLNTAIGDVLAGFNHLIDFAGAWNDLTGTLADSILNNTNELTALGTEIDHMRSSSDGATDSIKTQTASLYDWGQAASEASGQVKAATAALAAQQQAIDTNAVDHDTASQFATGSLSGGAITQQQKANAAAALEVQKQTEQQALADAKTYYADQAQTAKDAADATKTQALADAQATLDGTKAEIASEKTAYDDRAQADIAARQAQTASALSELQKQNTAANVAAQAAKTAADAQAAAVQNAADESDAAWKDQVTAIKDAATTGENTLHASNDATLKSAVDTANSTYAAQSAAIDAEVKARQEADTVLAHNAEQATAADLANIDKQKTAALDAINQETAAYAAQEAARVAAINATASAQVKALNDTLAAEKQANSDRLAVNSMTQAHGAVAGQQLGQFLTASEGVQADTQAALDAKAAGNQALAAQDQQAAQQQQATAQALSDQLSQIDQATADQMVQYRIQQDTATTAAQVAAIQQQATNQTTALANELNAEKQSQAAKTTATTAYYAGLVTQENQALADYKWNLSQQEQSFKDAEDAKKAADKAALDVVLANLATEQTAEDTRHADAIAKINSQAATDTAAIAKTEQVRKDAATAATTQRNADYAAATAQRAADYKDATDKINAQSALDIGQMQAAQTAADNAFTARSNAADAHFKDVQKQITDTYTADTNAIAAAQKANSDALTQMAKDTQSYADKANASFQSVVDHVSAVTGAMGATSNFHAPGKGPLGAPGGTVTASDFKNQPSDVQKIFTKTYDQPGQDPAQIWASQANGSGASDIATTVASSDIIAKSALFLQGAAEYSYGTGANTFCERFTANMEGRSVMDTAAVAGEHRAAAGQLQHSFPPPAGAEVYYGANAGNEWEGHDGISLGNGMFRSVTSSGIRDASISAWADSVAPYLGWVPQGTPMYRDGGVVPGAIGAPQLVIAHGGEEYLGVSGQRGTLASRGDGIDYRRLAEEIVTAQAKQPIFIQMNNRLVGEAMRTDQRRFAATSPANGVGGRH